MSVPSALPLEPLFAPGIRLGWTFRDHRVPAAPYLEPQPDPDTLHKQMTERASITQSRYAVERRWVIKPGLLSPPEEALIGGGGLFPTGYQQQIGPNLVRLDAFLVDLARSTGYAMAAPPPAPAWYTCLALEPGARSARAEMLTALAILFRHLREDALAMLGGGTAAFMRLGHHAEAEQAASYIGRQHTFVLSQRTVTMGGNESLTRSDTQGYGDGDNSSRSRQEFHLGRGTRTRGTSTSRNWSTGLSQADGTSWSDATTAQRVYEYAVEPAILQKLPDHALLLADRPSGGPQLRPVECDPAIATLAGVSPPHPAQPPMSAGSGTTRRALDWKSGTWDSSRS